MNLFRSTFLAAALLAFAGPALAEDVPATPPATTAPEAAAPAPTPTAEGAIPTDRVVAIVDGEPITELDLAAAEPDLQQAIAQFPQEQQFAALVKAVIDIRLMARAAEAAAIDKETETAHVLTYVHDRALRNAYLQGKLTAAVTDEALKARYDAEVAKYVPTDQVHAVHILVNTEEEAKAIIAQLDQGGDFAAIAKEKSTDAGSGAQGGDLGFFGHGQMVKPFDDAAFALDVGAYTKTPVKSDFGWHVIKVLEKRKSSGPGVRGHGKDRLRRDLVREFILADIEKLHAAAKIEIVRPPEPPPADAATGRLQPGADAAPPTGPGACPNRRGMATISPLAPAAFPRLPAIAGGPFRRRRSRHQVQEPARRAARGLRQGHDGCRRLHAIEVPVRPGRLVQGGAEIRQGAGAARQLRQRQCLHRQTRPRDDEDLRRHGGQGRRLPAA